MEYRHLGAVIVSLTLKRTSVMTATSCSSVVVEDAMSEDCHNSNNLPFRWHGHLPPALKLNVNRRADPTADFTAQELVELADLRRYHGIGDSVEEIREALGHGIQYASPLEGDSNFDFDNHTLGEVARKFYQVEEDNHYDTVKVVHEAALSNPSVQDAIRSHGTGSCLSPELLPFVSKAVADVCKAELAAYDVQRRKVR
jgi:hypothetical protein